MQERDGYRLLRQGTYVPSVLIVRVADPDLDPDPDPVLCTILSSLLW